MIYWNLTINALYYTNSSHYMTPHQRCTMTYCWSKLCQENPIGTSKRIILTELKVALEYEIVSHLKSNLTELYEKQDEEYYGDKMGDLAQLAVDGYLSWTRDAQEAVSSLLTDTAWEVWKMKLNSVQPCAGNNSTCSGNNSTNSGNKGTNAKPITRAEYQSWRNTRLHFEYWVSRPNFAPSFMYRAWGDWELACIWNCNS